MGRGDQSGLSVPQAAQALGVSRETVRSWSDMGYLESSRNERGERCFSREQIDCLIRQLQHQHVEPLIDRSPADLRR
jgi:excisionase family DNA binding protein